MGRAHPWGRPGGTQNAGCPTKGHQHQHDCRQKWPCEPETGVCGVFVTFPLGTSFSLHTRLVHGQRSDFASEFVGLFPGSTGFPPARWLAEPAGAHKKKSCAPPLNSSARSAPPEAPHALRYQAQGGRAGAPPQKPSTCFLLLSPSGPHFHRTTSWLMVRRSDPPRLKKTGRFGRGAGAVRAVFGAGRLLSGRTGCGWVWLLASASIFGGNGRLLAGLLAA